MKNYVDDFLLALRGLDPGVRYDEESMKMVRVEVLGDSDMDAPEDARTMEELRKIANTVFQCMQFTIDCPSIQEEGMVPVLDTAMYIGEDGLIKYQF